MHIKKEKERGSLSYYIITSNATIIIILANLHFSKKKKNLGKLLVTFKEVNWKASDYA